jgi:hypothetical protein
MFKKTTRNWPLALQQFSSQEMFWMFSVENQEIKSEVTSMAK